MIYKGKNVDIHFRCDLLVENLLVVELRSVNELNSVFEPQFLTNVNLLQCPKGILINYNIQSNKITMTLCG